MFPEASVFASVLLASRSFGYKQPIEYLEALEVLGATYANPASIIDGLFPSPLSPDVIGRVDVTTTFYLFGLLLEGSEDNSTQLIATPSTVTVQSAVVEPPVTAVSYIAEMVFPTVNMTALSRSTYCLLRRYPSSPGRVLSIHLAPQIAKELNMTTTNITEIIQLKTATNVCAVSTQYCTSDNQQYEYESHEARMSFMTELLFGETWQGGMNTGWSRYIHKNMVKYRPEVHCPHVGPNGGDMCIARLHRGHNPFNQTLLAYSSSYNAADMKDIPTSSVMELVKVQTEVVLMTTIAFVSSSMILKMVNVQYLFSFLFPPFLHALPLHVVQSHRTLLTRVSLQYREMSFENQRNTVTYVLDTFITGVVLVLQLFSVPILANKYTFDYVNMLKAAALLISGLYIFELTYRPCMRCHCSSITFAPFSRLSFSLVSFPTSDTLRSYASGEIWLFQATTEQTVFIGLFTYCLRVPLRWTCDMLRFGAVQSFIFKTAFAAYLLVFWAQQFHAKPGEIALRHACHHHRPFDVYGAWAVWCLAEKVNKAMRLTPIRLITTRTN
ncbi:hypothetical protein BT96DRAFT_945593 [Gymnopus androsaceus JB14]|uniref:Uncharacterized protein n=1 Tax=Gymnopus androsaceus JB14 TaxID=1447944 RepID=A0A6A4GYZ7_9AGAR|nr:hypothetical protein BT96DRAFT_945593 [Gymnopus androsaceus JB14]